jgi:hypothetical protein
VTAILRAKVSAATFTVLGQNVPRAIVVAYDSLYNDVLSAPWLSPLVGRSPLCFITYPAVLISLRLTCRMYTTRGRPYRPVLLFTGKDCKWPRIAEILVASCLRPWLCYIWSLGSKHCCLSCWIANHFSCRCFRRWYCQFEFTSLCSGLFPL